MRKTAVVLGVLALAVALLLMTHVRSAIMNLASAPFDEAEYAEEPSGLAPQPASSSTRTAVVPILTYHIVRPSYPGDDAAVQAIAVTPQTFDAQLAHLQASGYHVISFRELEAYLASSTTLLAKPIILSFDDGWSDQYMYAFPILEKYRDTATFFVFTNAIGRKGFMTWQDLKNLNAAGMTIGDHSESHPYLTKIADPQKLWNEIDGSKVILQNELGIPVTEFAYPFGQYSAYVIALVQQAGFLSARGDYWSGDTQSADHRYELSAINAPTTTAAFVKDFP
jgi:peptidoglycan/xylan/chitin deacetylase (PgdA/CDA1 family)